jgi:D-alanyl-D-alanine carboxypeptidase
MIEFFLFCSGFFLIIPILGSLSVIVRMSLCIVCALCCYEVNVPLEFPFFSHAFRPLAHTGDLVLCDAALRTAPYGRGWDPEDCVDWYGAPVSAFVVNDNTFRVVATPAEAAGMPALFRVEPDLPSLRVDWRVTTSTNRNHAVAYTRTPGSAGMRFTGRIPLGSKPWTPELAVADPARHFGESLRS